MSLHYYCISDIHWIIQCDFYLRSSNFSCLLIFVLFLKFIIVLVLGRFLRTQPNETPDFVSRCSEACEWPTNFVFLGSPCSQLDPNPGGPVHRHHCRIPDTCRLGYCPVVFVFLVSSCSLVEHSPCPNASEQRCFRSEYFDTWILGKTLHSILALDVCQGKEFLMIHYCSQALSNCGEWWLFSSCNAWASHYQSLGSRS